MNTETLKTISLEDFKRDSHLIDYVDENIVILDQVDTTTTHWGQIRINCFLMIFCLEGRSPLNINGRDFMLTANHCAILLPNALVRRTDNSYKCNIRIVAISHDFLKDVIGFKKETWDIGNYLYGNPIFPINRETSYKFYLYKELALASIAEKPRPFMKTAKKHLFSAIFCELMSKLYEDIPVKKEFPEYRNDRSNYIFRKFMEKVSEDDGTHRSVSYYADMLCYSAKHLSTVVKRISGRAPLSIINNHAMECIKYQLKHSDLSMKEVADLFNFANPSFFGKFVKQHLGMSPQQYRNSPEE